MEISSNIPARNSLPSTGTGKAETIALAGLALQVVLSLLTFSVYLYSAYAKELTLQGAGPVFAESLHLIPGNILWLLCFLRLRMARLAQEEEKELERMRQRAEASSSLFESSQKPEAYTARGRQARLERFFVPAVTVLTAAAMIACSGLVLRGNFYAAADSLYDRLGVCAAFLVALAFVGFVFSQYVIGLSSEPAYGKLRPAGAYLLSNSFLLFLCAVSLVLLRAKLPLLQRLIEWALPVAVGLLGIEYIANFILDFFRPRVPGKELRPPYDSRVLGLFSQPGSLWIAVADTLDYQFGFRVSKTWVYHFIARLALPLLAFQLVCGLLLTCLVIVGPGEICIVERFGRPQESIGPGLNLKLPWPIELAYSVKADNIHRLTIGFHSEEESEEEETKEQGHSHGKKRQKLPENVVLWTHTHHGQEDYILVASRETPPATRGGGQPTNERVPLPIPASLPLGTPLPERTAESPERSVPVNLLSVSMAVHFQVSNPLDFSYRYADPLHYLENIAYRELVQVASSADLHDLMGPMREALAEQVRARIEKRAAAAQLGIRLLYVGILEVHPPVQVADAFEKGVEAQQESESLIVQARAHAGKTVQEARSMAYSTMQEALAYQFQREAMGQSLGQSFDHHLSAYRAGRGLYLSRNYLSSLEETLRGKRKLLLSARIAEQRIFLKLEDKIQADLLNIDLQK